MYDKIKVFDLKPVLSPMHSSEFDKNFPLNVAKEIIHEKDRSFIRTIKVNIYGLKDKPVIIRYPENWLEALKERFAPKWLLKKYPIKYKEIKVDPMLIFPEMNIAVPNFGAPVRIAVSDGDIFRS